MDIHTRAIARACTPVLLALLAWSCAASAQSLPRPAEFYFDEDNRSGAVAYKMAELTKSEKWIDRVRAELKGD